MHQGAQPQCRTQVIAEYKKSSDVGAESVERHAVRRRRHGVFSDAKVEIPPAMMVAGKISGGLVGDQGLGRWGQVGRPSQQPGNVGRQGVEHLSGGDPRSRSDVGGEDGQVAIPAGGKLPMLHLFDFACQFRIAIGIAGKLLLKVFKGGGSARPQVGSKMLDNLRRYQKVGIHWPAIGGLGRCDLLLT